MGAFTGPEIDGRRFEDSGYTDAHYALALERQQAHKPFGST